MSFLSYKKQSLTLESTDMPHLKSTTSNNVTGTTFLEGATSSTLEQFMPSD